MARTNLIPNPSFRSGITGYSPINGATITMVTGQAFYGSEALQVTKSDRNSSGVQTGFVPVTTGLDYAYSVYVLVPVTVPTSDDSNLILTVSWFSASNELISESTSDVVVVKPRGGWVRLTGIDAAPNKAVTARLSVSQLAAGRAKQVFYVDAMLFEQASYVGGYLDNINQTTETQLVNSGLSTYPVPSIGGLVLDADVILGDLVLNTVDENNAVWVCTDITGWWGHSAPDVIDITRGVEDGSYDVSGRYQSRVITVSGSILLPDPSLLGAARDRLIAATNLVRKGAWLRTNENPTRAAFVRLSGRPEIETVNARGRTDFQIGLKAADPIRYEWNDEDPEGLTSSIIDLDPVVTNLVTNPGFESVGASSQTLRQNFVNNPRAIGTKISIGDSIEVDPVGGARAFKYTAPSAFTSFTSLASDERPVAAEKQHWWSRIKVRRDDSVFGARRITSKLVFRDSAGNILTHQKAPVGSSGVLYRWLGTPYNSPSERVEKGVRRVNLFPDPTAGGQSTQWGVYFTTTRSFESTDAPHGGTAYTLVTASTATATTPQGAILLSVPGSYQGMYVTASVMIRGAAGAVVNVGGRTSDTEGQDGKVVTLTGGWDRVTVQYRASTTANVTAVGMQIHTGSRPAGYTSQKFQFNGLIIETGTSASPAVDFFYGGRVSTSTTVSDETTVDLIPDGIFYRWIGTANASQSERYEGTSKLINYISNPSAESAVLSVAGEVNATTSIVANTATGPGAQSYRILNTDRGYSATKLRTEDQGPTSPGQRWWARGRLTQGTTSIGARRLSSRIVFRDTSGAILYPAQTILPSGSDVINRWTGIAHASASEQITSSTKRVNVCHRPSATVGWSAWYGSGGSGALTYERNSGLPQSDTFVRTQNSAAATGTLVGPYLAGIPIQENKTYTFSAYVRSTRDGTWRLGIQFSNSGGVMGSESAPGGLTTIPANTWGRVSGTITAPAGATLVRMTPWINVIANQGDIVDATAALVEESSTADSYFDGATLNVGSSYSDQQSFDFIPPGVFTRWTGTASASASERYEGTTVRTNRVPNPLNTSSTTGVNAVRGDLSSGTNYTRLTVTDTAAGALAQRLQVGGSTGAYAIPVTPGEAVSFSVDIRSSASPTASVAAYWYSSAGVYMNNEFLTTTFPIQTTAFTRFQGVATAIPDAARLIIYVGWGSGPKAVGDTLDIARILVGDSGPYFDGDTTNTGSGNLQRIVDYALTADAPEGAATADLVVYRDPMYSASANDIELVDSLMLTQDSRSTPANYFDGSSVGLASGVTYRWSKGTAAGPSIRIEGDNTRTNDTLDARFSAPGSWYRNTTKMDYSFNGDGTVAITSTANSPTGELVIYNSGLPQGFEGDIKSARVKIKNTGASTVEFYGSIRAYAAVGGVNDSPNTDFLTIEPGETKELTFIPVVMGPGSQGYRPLVRVRTFATGSSILVSEFISESVSDGGTPGTYFDGSYADTAVYATGIAPGPVELISTSVAPAGAARADLLVARDASHRAPSSDVLRLTQGMLSRSESAAAPAYFDGAQVPANAEPDSSSYWSGTANASPSIYGFPGVSGVTGTNALAIQSTVWYSSGSKSLRLSSTAMDRGQASVDLGSLISGGLVPGVQYTASVLAHREADGVQNASLTFESFTGAIPLVSVSSQIPTMTGTYRTNLTFTVPTGASSTSLRVYSGELDGESDLWIDDFIVVLGSEPSPYFDGLTEATYSSNYSWTGTSNQSTSTKKPSGAMYGTIVNRGTADVTAVLEVTGPLGAGSTIANSSTGEVVTLVNELRGVGNAATVTSKELTDNVVTLTTEKPHNLVVGDIIKVAGVGSPFDAVDETLTVTAVSSLFPYSLNYVRVWPNIDRTVSSGQVALAYNDKLSIDTYERSVTFNGEVRGNRSRVNTLIDWIKLVPGDNVITFTDTPNKRVVQTKSRLNNLVTLSTADAHFFIPGEEVYVNLPTDATLAKKSLTSNVVTITTASNHGFSVGDLVNISSTETSTVINKALTSNVATLTTAVLGAFNTGDSLVVELPVVSSVTAKSAASSVVTLTTAAPHGYSVGDSVSVAVPTGSPLSSKSLTNNVATLGTSAAHGFSIGDTVTVTLPTGTTVVGKYTSGESVILATSTAHGFSVGDRIAVALPISATTTTTRTNSGPNSYLTTITTTATHNFVVGDRIVVDGKDRIVETVPSGTTFTYLDYSKTVAGTDTVAASIVSNTTNTRLSGTFPITSVPSTTQFSYNV